MPRIDPQNFLDALATFLAEEAGLEFLGTPRELWVGPADESVCPVDDQSRVGVYSELRAYDGSIGPVGLPAAMVQIRTVGFVEPEARDRAAAIANALLDSNGRPLRNVAFPAVTSPTARPAFKLLGILNLRGPALIGLDAKNRSEVVLNMDCQYVPA